MSHLKKSQLIKRHYIMRKISILQEDITILNVPPFINAENLSKNRVFCLEMRRHHCFKKVEVSCQLFRIEGNLRRSPTGK